MIWEQALHQHLAADSSLNMLGGRIHWDVAPPLSTAPYLIIQEVGSGESTAYDGGSGGSFPSVHFTIWAKTRLQANTIRRLLRESIEGKELGNASVTIEGHQSTVDDSMKPILYGAIIETRLHISSNNNVGG
jgi:hypothetical protein